MAAVLLQGRADRRVVPVQLEDLLVGLVADGPEEHRRGDLPGPIDPGVENLVVVGLQLQPRAPVRDHGSGGHGASGGVGAVAVVDTWGADQLTHHHPLRPINNEGPPLGHQGEVPHEDLLLLDLARLADHQADLHLEGGAVVVIPVPALLFAVLEALEPVSSEVQDGIPVEDTAGVRLPPARLHGEVELQIAGKVLDRGDLIKHLADALPKEPLIGPALDLHQVGQVRDLGDSGEREVRALPTAGHPYIQPELSQRGGGSHGSALRLRLHGGRPHIQGDCALAITATVTAAG